MKATKNSAVASEPNAVCVEIGKVIKAHRHAKELSQEALAFAAAVDRTYVSQIERGVGNPSILTLVDLCRALGITLAELFATVTVSDEPGEQLRRTNRATPKEPQPPKSRLR